MHTYEQFIKDKGLKNTSQRQLLFEAIMNNEDHLTVDDLLDRVKKMDSKLGYTTVYRFLKLMVDSGLVHEHNFDGKTRYEVMGGHHDHLICTKCGKIIEFECDEIEKLQDKIASQHSFKVESHKHELYGLCVDCA